MTSKRVINAWIVPIPDLPVNPYNFFVNVNINSQNYVFTFMFYGERWHLWVTFPDNTRREAGIFPNVTSWTGYTDFGLTIATTLAEIGQNDLQKLTIYLVEWSTNL